MPWWTVRSFPPKTLLYLLRISSPLLTMIDIANDDDAERASLLESSPTANVGEVVEGEGGENRRETSSITTNKSILFFWADWHAPSRPGGAFDDAARALLAASRGDDSGIRFYRIMAEGAPRLSRKVRRGFFSFRPLPPYPSPRATHSF